MRWTLSRVTTYTHAEWEAAMEEAERLLAYAHERLSDAESYVEEEQSRVEKLGKAEPGKKEAGRYSDFDYVLCAGCSHPLRMDQDGDVEEKACAVSGSDLTAAPNIDLPMETKTTALWEVAS